MTAGFVRFGDAALRAAFAALSAIAAFLIIAVQPASTSFVLPFTGGSPVFWQTSQALFQAMLLIGYVSVAVLLRRRIVWRLMAFGILMVAGAVGLLLTRISPQSLASTTLTAVEGTMLIGRQFGPAFVLLSTTSLACQSMYVSVAAGRSPFWLFAASNAGSLAAALSYPFLIQPHWNVTGQLGAWQTWSGLTAFFLGVAAMVVAARCRLHPAMAVGAGEPVSLVKLVRWVIGGVGPVGLSLSCTTYLATDLGSHPIVWLGPFAAYLGTMIIAFSRWGGRLVAAANIAAPFAVSLLLVGLLAPWPNTFLAYSLHLAGVTVLLTVWHGWFASARPAVGNLEWYYCSATLGGFAISAVLGVLVPAALDPVIFGNPNARWHRLVFGSMAPEYLFFVVISGALVAWAISPYRREGSGVRGSIEGLLLGVALLITARAFVSALSAGSAELANSVVSLGALVTVAVILRSRHQLLACVSTILVGAALSTPAGASIIEHRRSPFGQLRVQETRAGRQLTHGSTAHGTQAQACFETDAELDCSMAGGYYHDAGPIGTIVRLSKRHRPRLDAAVIGLGVGTMAAYCQGDDVMTFFEIDRTVIDIAGRHFRFLSYGRRRCRAIDVEVGDARIMLRQGADARFDLLVADAFSSDSVPVHLLTAEAMREFMATVRSGGILAYHTSNRYFDLQGILLANAEANGLKAVSLADRPQTADPKRRRLATQWVFVARDDSSLRQLEAETRLGEMSSVRRSESHNVPPWTDERYSLLTALRR